MKKLLGYDSKKPSTAIYRLMLICSFSLIVFGLFACGAPGQALAGLQRVFVSPAVLITDYIAVGGLDGAFLNAGLAMLFAALLIRVIGANFGGLSIGTCFIVGGFALFGKTLPNMLPIVLGAWLYAKFRKEPFTNHVYSGLHATCLGPLVSHAALNAPIANAAVRLLLALLLGIVIGFMVPAVAALCATVHKGMLVFNIGLTAGMVSSALVAFLKNFGWDFAAASGWTAGNNLKIGAFLSLLFLMLIAVGFVLNGMSFAGLAKLRSYTGQSPSDYTRLEGLPVTLMNMGILGFMMMGYVLAVGGPLNGPTVGGILTVCGFGAFCMHYYNVIWPMLGIVLLSFVSVWSLNEPGILLAALFVTCICPIAGRYGPMWGVLAGMIHVSLVRQTAVNFGWMNLYNNGFAAGLTCIVILPLINVFKKELEQARHK